MANMYAGSTVPQRPGAVTAIAIITIVSGVSNIVWSLVATLGIVLGTLGIGLLCAPVTLAPLILGIFELIYGIKLLSNPPKAMSPSNAIAILEICCILVLNVLSVVAGILALVFYSQDEVKAYFAAINAA